MPPTTPADLMTRFAQLVADRDLDRLVALYEPTAVFIPAPGALCVGLDQIRAALAQMLALQPVLETTVDEVHVSGDLALVINRWQMTGTAPDGSPVRQGGTSADVLRRQADGTWLVAIDHP